MVCTFASSRGSNHLVKTVALGYLPTSSIYLTRMEIKWDLSTGKSDAAPELLLSIKRVS